ncbi:MAG: FkbM family methyltransferase [Acidobacteria bacterium]|nr:FkbM family methyltransferase [Acidobacteriota bacterium]
MTHRAVPAVAWLLYREGRKAIYTLMGRNPLYRGQSAMTLRQEWHSIRGLRRALRHPPERITSDSAGRVQWRTICGDFWTPSGARPDYASRLAAEMYADVYEWDLDTTRPPVVFDCGANIGFFTRYALDRGAQRVIAFEPSPENTYCLRMNLSPEIESGRVIVIEKGVWDKQTTLSFSTRNVANPGGHHIVENGDGGGTITINTTSIDEAANELDIERVDYIKMDVEGAEVRALEGAKNVMRKHRPRLCIATEHTADLYANTLAVIESVRKLDSTYRYLCTEVHPYRSLSKGKVLTPYSILFY